MFSWYLLIFIYWGNYNEKNKKNEHESEIHPSNEAPFPFPISSSYWISSTTNNKIIYFIINQPLTNKFGHL